MSSAPATGQSSSCGCGPANSCSSCTQAVQQHGARQGGIAMAGYAAPHTKVDAVPQTTAGMVDEQMQEIVFVATLL
jgi:hypothetical protein